MVKSKTLIWTLIIFLLIILSIVIATIFISNNEVVCTQEVIECSDGTFVSRNQKNSCEFDLCPTFTTDSGSGLLSGLFQPTEGEQNEDDFTFDNTP